MLPVFFDRTSSIWPPVDSHIYVEEVFYVPHPSGRQRKKKVEIPTRRLGEDVPKPRITHPPVERNVSPVVSRLQSHCAERRYVPRLLRCWTTMDVRTLAHGMHHNDRAISDIGASMSGSINIKAEFTN